MAVGMSTSRSKAAAPDMPDADQGLAALIVRDRLAVLGVALGYLGNPADAEDVTQDVFFKACQELRAGRSAAELTRDWMFRVTATTAIDIGRRRSAWWRRVVPATEAPDVPSPESSPEDHVVEESGRGAVLAAVRRLTPRLRDVVLRYYFGDQDIGEVARALRISPAAVKTRLFRARAQLRPLLGDRDAPGAEVDDDR
jgi:RNA polymerase sigma factor (sigma-70 family)